MIECSMFGYLEMIDGLCSYLRFYNRTDTVVRERIYSNGLRSLTVAVEDEDVYLVSRSLPDMNKSRVSFCSVVQKTRVITSRGLEGFLSALGFVFVKENKVSVTSFRRHPVEVEISKWKSEYSNVDRLHLVKVSVTTENANDGERILSKMVEELESQVQLLRPNLK
ncbi:hypothetical protein CWI42_080680 [Ordospora colligata]|uniref:Mediator of RNA polymerase II transcription subunit 18 n=1 Tax=Ordospora colligata OC4 TaxID=1354746 RepID=A0A0B2UJE3_9MICR|nr:uncharacterized protein M896_080690 [Ordospora colligata OC4]KHN69334.1 hypothetical protein M896_080690 [Ordospora colligata OC4]TBU14848.1 hypothetical protein CWI41_080680 [Ordospora colligata]TBU14979.1 hypothetical protein CWI40_080700 [Ordospora colligata]TBU18363.1 hypothetical protein CWI42_080680 [Ordospora colligata]